MLSLKLPFSLRGPGPPCNTWCLGPTRVSTLNGILIGSAVFAGLTKVTNRQTDRPCYSVCSSRPLSLRCDLIIITLIVMMMMIMMINAAAMFGPYAYQSALDEHPQLRTGGFFRSMPTAVSTFGFGRRFLNSPQQRFLCHLHSVTLVSVTCNLYNMAVSVCVRRCAET